MTSLYLTDNDVCQSST